MFIVEQSLRAAGWRIIGREPISSGIAPLWCWKLRSGDGGFGAMFALTEHMIDEVDEQNAGKFRHYVDDKARQGYVLGFGEA